VSGTVAAQPRHVGPAVRRIRGRRARAGQGAGAGRHIREGRAVHAARAGGAAPDHRAEAGRPGGPLPTRSGARARHPRRRRGAAHPDRARRVDPGDRCRHQRRLPTAGRRRHLRWRAAAAAASDALLDRHRRRGRTARRPRPVRRHLERERPAAAAHRRQPGACCRPGRAVHARLGRPGAAGRRVGRGIDRLLPGCRAEHGPGCRRHGSRVRRWRDHPAAGSGPDGDRVGGREASGRGSGRHTADDAADPPADLGRRRRGTGRGAGAREERQARLPLARGLLERPDLVTRPAGRGRPARGRAHRAGRRRRQPAGLQRRHCSASAQ
jgi:hypothetical protein